MKKVLFVAALSVALVLVMAGTAIATVCINVSKSDGAGNMGDVIVSGVTGEELVVPTNPGGQLAGGFVDVYVDLDGNLATDGDRIQVLDETFILNVKHALAAGLPLPELPEGAHAAAGCGQAVDHAGC